jgi:putative ABC transport system permease protein
LANILQLFSKEFIMLVTIAFVIAAPLSYYFMNGWLQGFAYHIELSWWMFALGAILTIAIALVTISFQTVKAAVSNPVDSLRNE